MSTQAPQEHPLPVADPQVEAALRPLLEGWLAELGLADAFANPIAHQGEPAFEQQLAQRLGIDLKDNPAVQVALAARIATSLQEHPIVLSEEQQALLLVRLRDEMLGLSILEPLIQHPHVYEIMVNGPAQVFVARRGRLEKCAFAFDHTEHLMRVIQRMLLPFGERVDQRSPRSTIRMPDGSRLSVIIPPLALNGPCLTLWKPVTNRLTINDLVRFGSLNPEMAELLSACIEARLNIVVAGGAGSGKMTFLNVLTSFIPDDERIVTVEEVAELQVHHEHVVSLQSRLPDSNGEGSVSMRDLVRTAAQMRPERIILGEIQGPEVFEWLQVIRRGHDGSMATMHANSPTEALEQLEMMIKLDQPNFPVTYLRSFMAMVVNLVVQQTRFHDGSRKVTHISEVVPSREHGYELRDLIVFKQSGVDARGKLSGQYVVVNPVNPAWRQRMEHLNILLPPSLAAPTQP